MYPRSALLTGGTTACAIQGGRAFSPANKIHQRGSRFPAPQSAIGFTSFRYNAAIRSIKVVVVMLSVDMPVSAPETVPQKYKSELTAVAPAQKLLQTQGATADRLEYEIYADRGIIHIMNRQDIATIHDMEELMEQIFLTEERIRCFHAYLVEEERSPATIEKYLRDIRKFQQFAGEKPIAKELVVAYKRHLQEQNYAIRSINSMLAALNQFLQFLGLHECKVRQLRMQREIFCSEEKELSYGEYLRLLEAAQSKPKISLILQTICATGIRVSELRHFTVGQVRKGTITVSCKSKLRTILLPGKLRKQLLKFAAEQKILRGSIFVTQNGHPLDRSYIWAEMKKLCGAAGVKASKVFPHNLRKLFARAFYKIEKDIAKLADILGHSSIETTRIYIMSTGIEHRRKMEQLKLVL